jgi:hypothetical protein
MATPGERFGRGQIDIPYRPETCANDPREIVIQPGWNVRDMTSPDTLAWIHTLSVAIRTAGYDPTKPITVRYDKKTGIKTLVDGQCRLMACRKLWDDGLQVNVPEIRTEGDEANLTAQSISGNAGHPLTQWEIGEGCRRLLSYGWSKEKIAAHICKPERYVTEAIELSNVPLEAKAMLSAGEVTGAAVLAAVKEHGPEAAVKPLKEAVAARKDTSKPAPRHKELSERERKLQEPPEPQQQPVPAPKRTPERKLLDLADAMCRLILDDNIPLNEAQLAAEEYKKMRGLVIE